MENEHAETVIMPKVGDLWRVKGHRDPSIPIGRADVTDVIYRGDRVFVRLLLDGVPDSVEWPVGQLQQRYELRVREDLIV